MIAHETQTVYEEIMELSSLTHTLGDAVNYDFVTREEAKKIWKQYLSKSTLRLGGES